jgi:hypothetical protein
MEDLENPPVEWVQMDLSVPVLASGNNLPRANFEGPTRRQAASDLSGVFVVLNPDVLPESHTHFGRSFPLQLGDGIEGRETRSLLLNCRVRMGMEGRMGDSVRWMF